ncbi:MAG: methyltransferase domain-containing protein, partial [Candidatus Nomurabacteria bacterium]|nr:methyltransferase domain-containing protein [Candidatus Nomurabacteria bacterium]
MAKVKMTINDILNNGKTARENVLDAIARAEADDRHALLEIVRERALARADEIDAKIASGENVGRLAGVPFVAKDNFLTLGSKTTAAAKMLENFTAPLQATAVERLENEGAICIGKTNLDAFAHGGSTENSAFGATKNAHDDRRVAGGSSGGSAVAVARGIVPFALGSDTGGSIRQPASFNGVVGYKPTYGMISRYGVVAMASSTDVVGPIAGSVADIELLCDILSGPDGRDGTVLAEYFGNKIIDKKNDETIKTYEKYAKDYSERDKNDYIKSADWQNLQNWLKDSLADTPKNAKIFEIGSGTGRDAEYLRSLGYQVQTSDVVKRFISELESKKLNPTKFDILADEFTEKYDIIIATAVLLHFDKNNLPKIFTKIFNVLNENGKFLVCVQTGEGSMWKDNLTNGKRYFEFHNENDFTKMLENAGFNNLHISYNDYRVSEKKWLQVVCEKPELKPLKIGLIKEFMDDGVDADVKARINQFADKLRAAGHAVDSVSLPMVKYAIPIYYIVVPAEIS